MLKTIAWQQQSSEQLEILVGTYITDQGTPVMVYSTIFCPR